MCEEGGCQVPWEYEGRGYGGMGVGGMGEWGQGAHKLCQWDLADLTLQAISFF